MSRLLTSRKPLLAFAAGSLTGSAAYCLLTPPNRPSPLVPPQTKVAVAIQTDDDVLDAPPTTFANDIRFPTARHLWALQLGLPQTEQLQFRESYVASVNFKTRVPNWVLEHLTKETLKGNADRQGITFFADESVPSKFRAQNEDYWRSGFSRGHLVPAGNNKQSQQAMRDTFALSANIVPQDLDHNVWYWNRLELFVRDLTEKFDDVYVLSGPAWVPEEIPAPAVSTITDSSHALSSPSQSSSLVPTPPPPPTHDSVTSSPLSENPPPPTRTRWVNTAAPTHQIRYPVTNKTQVAVPTHLFKAVLAVREGRDTPQLLPSPDDAGDAPPPLPMLTPDVQSSQQDVSPTLTPPQPPTYHFAAFLIPNKPIPENTPFTDFQTTRTELEKVVGFEVFPNLANALWAGDSGDVGDVDVGGDDNNDGTIAYSTLQPRVESLCAHPGSCIMISPANHRLYFFTRALRNARDLARFERTVGKVLASDAVPDVEFMEMLARRVEEIEEDGGI
ncbi:uncharacterized protein EV422DRAFT_518531 [Fimicolochytrium jonesii]|uniref:uncharacterized protein n=1 Tax=Fimicolochytrium jonesii TaxID=1396493 RepID=UPI0022FEE87C|nr:uncharacterized protein EV422DRAFT_518531 [Fimicolochytrium jonesii]KAI8823984.1 hypothetical protein EV422DRAFT_518531 [Fimicolochytrium jonesii]